MRVRSAIGTIGLLLWIGSAPGAAQEPGSAGPGAPGAGPHALDAVRLRGVAPTVDGRLDEAAWAGAARASGFVQLRPAPGAPASQPSEVFVLYDDEALYVAARLHDAHPDSIVARLGRRDESVHSDWFWVGVDSYHDRRTAFLFGVNPRGVQQDALAYDDTREDSGWDAVWDAAARVDSLGWTAELRIPLSQLRFGGGGTWGLNFRRQLARADEVAYWAPIPPDGNGLVSYFGELRGLEGLRAGRRLEVQPYSVARLTRAPGEAKDPFFRRTDLFGSVGADLKYGLTSNLMLTATINPDFGQVEADPSVVNLSAYETFFPERRPFFLEGADIFNTGFPRLFHSRRIGRSPRGRAPAEARYDDAPSASTILGAAKLTGKTAAGWSIGVLEAVTAEESARYVDASGAEASVPVEPLTNYAVARVTREFDRGRSAVGGMVTAVHRHLPERLDFLPAAAYTGSLDARRRFGGGDYEAEASLIGSYVLGSTRAIHRLQLAPGHYFQRPDAPHLEVDSARTSLLGSGGRAWVGKVGGGHWRWRVGGSAYSPSLEVNDLGYYPWAGEVSQYASLGYEQYRPGRVFRRWNVELWQQGEWTSGGERTDASFNASAAGQLQSHWSVDAWVMRHVAALDVDALRGGPALYKPARTMGGLTVGTDRRRPLHVRINSYFDVRGGGEGSTLDGSLTLSLRAADRLELSLRSSLERGKDETQYISTRMVQGRPRYLLARFEQTTASLTARMSYTFSPTLSLQLYAQPFVSAGEYDRFGRVARPRAERLEERLHRLGAGEIIAERTPEGSRRYRFDADGDGAPESSFADPDFNVQSIRSNAVLRWEYRPGSTLFVVWSHDRSAAHAHGSLAPGRDLEHLFSSEPTNVLMIKASYWLGL